MVRLNRKAFMGMLLAAALTFALAVPAFAQEGEGEMPPMELPPMPGEVVASDLLFPRGVAFGEDGTLYVAEAGNGGNVTIAETEDFGTVTGGLSGRITTIAPDGTVSALPLFFPSGLSSEGGLGLYRAYPGENTVWVVMNALALGPAGSIPLSDAVLEIDLTTGLVKTYIDLSQIEATVNADGSEVFDSNPADLGVGADGTLFIVDAGANAVYTWTEADGLAVFQVWPDNPVPDSIAVADDGSVYVGFLGAGLAPGAGKIEHWSAEGELIETFEGLTTVTDVEIGADGNVYAVQLFAFGEQGPDPMAGSVVMVSADGVTPVAEGLYLPFAIAQSPDGVWFVSVASAQFGPPVPGAVIQLPAAE